MKPRPPFKFADLAMNLLSFALAGSCSFFAGYMILRLQGMDNPPADLGLYFPDAGKQHSANQAVLVDPTATGAIDPAPRHAITRQPVAQPSRDESPVRDYRLLSVIDGIAFIEVTTLKGKTILPVSEGSELPGAGVVTVIEKVGGHWRVTAGAETIAAAQ